jgi:prevent-host-death family protein
MPEISKEEFLLSPEEWLKRVLDEPVVITDKGQPKVYMISRAVFESLYKGSRKALYASELSAEERKAILQSEMSSKHDHLNALMKED